MGEAGESSAVGGLSKKSRKVGIKKLDASIGAADAMTFDCHDEM
jgi:hypothetical protein